MAGTLAATITEFIAVEYRDADYTGAGTLTTTNMLPRYTQTAALAATGVLTGSVTARYARSAALTATGVLATSSTQKYAPAPAFTSTGTLSATATAVSTPISVVTSAVNNNVTTSTRNRSVTFAGYTPVLNDVVVLFSAAASTAPAYNVAPAGWTLLTTPTNSWPASSVEVSGGIYHVVDAADVSGGVTTYTATNYASIASYSTSLGAVLRNVNLADVTDAYDGLGQATATTPHTIEGGMTVSSASGLWLAVNAKLNSTAYPAAPTGWTTLQSGTNASGSAGAYRLLYRNALTSPGTLADITFTGTGVAGVYSTVSVVISSA